MELTERYQEWRVKTPRKEKASGSGGKGDETLVVGTMMSAWEFETFRSAPGGGTEKRIVTVGQSSTAAPRPSKADLPFRLTQPQPHPADPALAALTPGTEPSIASLLAASPSALQPQVGDLPHHLATEIHDPESLPPPPALGPERTRKNSWQARHDINGTVLKGGDVGNGSVLFLSPRLFCLDRRIEANLPLDDNVNRHHTIRPVKRLDSAGSHRASTEFVGQGSYRQHLASTRARVDSASSSSLRSESSSSLFEGEDGKTAGSSTETSPGLGRPAGEGKGKEEARLGRALVEEVVGPVVEKLSGGAGGGGKNASSSLEASEIEALSMIRKGFEDLAGKNPALAWKTVEGLLEGINECVLSSSLSLSAERS